MIRLIGQKIKDLRKQKNITQDDLSKIIGITTSAVGLIETDARNPSLEVLTKLADYFDVTTDYLLGMTDNSQHNVAEIPDELKRVGVELIEVMDNYKLTLDDIKIIKQIADKIVENKKG